MYKFPGEVPHTDYSEIVLPMMVEASNIALELQQQRTVSVKADGSPVTNADEAIEAYLYETLGRYFPEDGFVGEEATFRSSQSNRRWVVDPIDGTIQFIRNQEFWSVLVALEDDELGLVGAIAFPARDEIIYAENGKGCWELGKTAVRQLHVSNVDMLDGAYVLHNGIEFARQAQRAAGLAAFMTKIYAERGYADAFGHAEVIRGNADIMINFLTEHHDIAAVRVAAQEAGGRWSALDGSEALHSSSPGSITSNGILHSFAVEHLSRPD